MPTIRKTSALDTYMDLVREFPLRRINSAAAHARAKQLVLRLSTMNDSGTADYLDVLADLIADYERRSGKILDTREISAADLVRHRMEERGISISALARSVGLAQSNLSEMLSGKRDWSKTAISRLSAELNIAISRFFL